MSQLKIKSNLPTLITIPFCGELVQILPGVSAQRESVIREASKNAGFKDMLLAGPFGGIEILAAIDENGAEIATDSESALREFYPENEIPDLVSRMKAAAAKQALATPSPAMPTGDLSAQ